MNKEVGITRENKPNEIEEKSIKKPLKTLQEIMLELEKKGNYGEDETETERLMKDAEKIWEKEKKSYPMVAD